MSPRPKPSLPAATSWETLIPAGTHWSGILRRGLALRVVDVDGGANLSAVFHRQEDPLERYNMADTLKAQHTAHLTRGHALYTDMGRVIASITADTLGWHDPLGGVGDARLFAHKYGTTSYQADRNAMIRNGRDSLVLELAKYGLSARDLVANVNFFSKLDTRDDGALDFVAGHSPAGSTLDLRFEMNTLAAFSTAPHPLDPHPDYAPKAVKLIAYRAYPADGAAPEDDPCRRARAPRTCAASPTPIACLLKERRAMPIIESRLDPRDAIHDTTLNAGEPWLRDLKRGQVFRILDLKATRPSTRCSTGPTTRGALQRAGHHPRPAQPVPERGQRAAVEPGQPDGDDRRRYLRPSRHARRRVRGREQHRALCA